MYELFAKEVLATLIADLGIEAARRFTDPASLPLLQPGSIDGPSAQPLSVEDATEESWDEGETPRFLYRQRVNHRVALARAKWDWLILSTYYHPIRGRPSGRPGWRPSLLAGQFFTADFAARELPHESQIGQDSPSAVRLKLIQSRIAIASELTNSIDRLEAELTDVPMQFEFPAPLWPSAGIDIPWGSLMVEVGPRVFESAAHMRSYCGLGYLWSVTDTPASGIRTSEKARTPNLFAFASAIELAWILSRSDAEFKDYYDRYFRKATHLAHQYALRAVARHIVTQIWRTMHRPNDQTLQGRPDDQFRDGTNGA